MKSLRILDSFFYRMGWGVNFEQTQADITKNKFFSLFFYQDQQKMETPNQDIIGNI